MSIGKKILLACAALLLISIPATGAVLNTMYYRTLVDSTNSYMSMLVEQVAVNLTTRTREYEDTIYNSVQQWNLFESYFNKADMLDYHKRSMLSSFVNTRNTTRSPVLDMYILDKNGNKYYYNYQSQSFRDGLDAVEERMGQKETALPNGAGAVWFTVEEDAEAVYLMRSSYNVGSMQYEGTVAVGIERGIIQNQFERLESGQNGHLMILGQEDEIVFGAEEDMPEAQELLALEPKQEGVMHKVGDREFLFQSKPTSDGKWNVMYLVSKGELMGQAQKVKSTIITICIISVLAALVCTTLISGGITREIRHLIHHMQQMKGGNWQKIAPPFPRDEIGDVTRTYNQMVDDLQQVVRELAGQMTRTQQAQYRALQAEYMELQSMVNPHFIYNAMESINAKAKLEGQEEISMLCTKLGRLMRAAIRPKMERIPLEAELEYVREYLDIQKFMRKNQLEVFYDYDEVPKGCLIPALLIQPLAENAVLHGIDSMKDSAVIVVAVTVEDGMEFVGENQKCLVIRVSDNGAGMEEKQLEQMLELPDNEEKIHYGIQSVQKRIQICYGMPYGLQASSGPGEGTTMTVILPLEIPGDNIPMDRQEKRGEA